jgi:long-chain acyl-CoA synthetase
MLVGSPARWKPLWNHGPMSSDALARVATATLVTDLVAMSAAGGGTRTALVEAAGRRLTWGDLDEDVRRLASGLGDIGMVAGQRVLLVLGNRIEIVTTYLGVLRAQLVAVPVNPRAKVEDLAWMIADSGARLVVADAATVADARAASTLVRDAIAGARDVLDEDVVGRAREPRLVVVDSEPKEDEIAFASLRSAEARVAPARPEPETLACLLYTGSSLDRPRAAMLTHRALLANLEQAAAVTPPMVRSDDVVLGVLPLFHVYGLNAVLGTVLRHGATLVITDHFEPRGTLDVIVEHGVTVVPVAPAVFPHWLALPDLADAMGAVRLVLSGSAPLDRSVIERFRAATGVAVHQGYGLTEAAPVVTSTLASTEPMVGSLGAALPGVGLRLVDEHGHPPESGDPGEIQVCGPNLFSGYWPDAHGGPGADGWWSTGDVGFLDDGGDLFLVDRAAEVVVVAGFSVYPHEVEACISQVAGVEDAAVIGVPDDDTGTAVVAYVRAPGLDPAAADELAETVREHCATELAGFKQPSRIEVVDELPTTLTGRVHKGPLRLLERRRALGLLE